MMQESPYQYVVVISFSMLERKDLKKELSCRTITVIYQDFNAW